MNKQTYSMYVTVLTKYMYFIRLFLKHFQMTLRSLVSARMYISY